MQAEGLIKDEELNKIRLFTINSRYWATEFEKKHIKADEVDEEDAWVDRIQEEGDYPYSESAISRQTSLKLIIDKMIFVIVFIYRKQFVQKRCEF